MWLTLLFMYHPCIMSSLVFNVVSYIMIYSLLFTLEVPFDFSRILRRVKSETLRIGKSVVLWVF